MEKIEWYKSDVLRALILAAITAILQATGWVTENVPAHSAALADLVLQLIQGGALAWAAYARTMHPTLPITNTAVRKTEERAVNYGNSPQGGFIRPMFLAMLMAVGMVGVASVSLTGCEAIGMTKPASFDDRLAYAYGTHTAVLNAATSAVAAGHLTPDDAGVVLKMADESRVLLDAARGAAVAGDPATADGRLLLAINVLTQLQTYLNTKGVK